MKVDFSGPCKAFKEDPDFYLLGFDFCSYNYRTRSKGKIVRDKGFMIVFELFRYKIMIDFVFKREILGDLIK